MSRSAQFTAILAHLVGERWTDPYIEELQLCDGLLDRLEGHVGFDHFLGAEADLIRNVHGVAKAAGLDG